MVFDRYVFGVQMTPPHVWCSEAEGWRKLVWNQFPRLPNTFTEEVCQGTIGCTPNSVPMVFSWCSLEIIGDYNP